MKITPQEVNHVALLARLELAVDEVQPLTEHLDSILRYVEKLDELDTTGVQPTTHTVAISNAFRDDEVGVSLAQQDALANGPSHNEEFFIVPRVI